MPGLMMDANSCWPLIYLFDWTTRSYFGLWTFRHCLYEFVLQILVRIVKRSVFYLISQRMYL